MFDTIEQTCLGTALVFDTVLLMALLERRNWPFVRVPIVAMLTGVWLWHGGRFALLLATDLPGSWPWHVHSWCMIAMAAGLLLMPCGLLHGGWRVWRDRLDVQPRASRFYGLAYLPMLLAAPLALRFLTPDRGTFEQVTRPFELPYLVFSAAVNALAAMVFLRARKHVTLPQARPFLRSMAIVFLVMTGLKALYLVCGGDPDVDRAARLVLTLAPLAPALLFAYFIIRYHFLQIMLERSLVYGVILGSILLFHQLVFQDVSVAVPESYRLHVVFLEALALATLVLAYQPLRQRCAEALRYFLGVRVSAVREALRQLSMELSARAGQAPHALLDWFVTRLKETVQVDYVAGWLVGKDGVIDVRFGDTTCWPDARASWLFARLRSAQLSSCSQRHGPDAEICQSMQAAAAALAIVKSRQHATGLLIIGRGRNNRDLGEEETNAVLLLVEQLTITLDNGLLQAKHLAAERQAMQAEKLSALGLLASSIAHEIKNPLSAIKTIAAVLAEDLGPDSRHAEDIRLILGEVERLAATTSHLLELARPRAGSRTAASLPAVIGGTLRLVRHLAQERQIAIDTQFAADVPAVAADEHTVREIVLNLVTNALDAVGPGGRISIRCRRDRGFVVTEVSDDGPGLAAEVRERLFEPFLTTKPAGTGLGLYAVGRRIGELGGTIRCVNGRDRGTSFVFELPCTTDTEISETAVNSPLPLYSGGEGSGVRGSEVPARLANQREGFSTPSP